MARAALGWSLDETAVASGVNRRTILRYEQRESTMRTRNQQALRNAFEAAGLRFIDDGEFAGGVAPGRPSEENG
jgi:transcriptional regulator with XRE-family HTH domain